MPRIKEYTPSYPKLSPSAGALQAWETTGRRVGPLYNEAATSQREGGRVQGDMEKAKAWPFDIYALEAANAPQVRQASSDTTATTRTVAHVTLTGKGADEDNYGVAAVAGGVIRDAPPGLSRETTYEALADQQIAAADNGGSSWAYAHGESSAGAVGISRMARAAASGDTTVLQGSTVGGGRIRGAGISPDSDLPIDWRDNPDYNGQRLVDTPNGQFTPHQMDRFTKSYMDTWNRNMDKWNREQNRAGDIWNQARDKWVNGMNDAWSKNYANDIAVQNKVVQDYMKKNPDANIDDVRSSVNDKMFTTPTTYAPRPAPYDNTPQEQQRSWDNMVGTVTGAFKTIQDVYSPDNIVGAVKDTFGAMFGNQDDEPVATADIP